MRIIALALVLFAASVAGADEVTLTGDCSPAPSGCATGETLPASDMNAVLAFIGNLDDVLDALMAVDGTETEPPDLTAGTTIGGAAVQTGTDDDVPESGDFGAAVDLEADGSLSAGVVDAAAIAAGALTAGDAAADLATQAELDAVEATISNLTLDAAAPVDVTNPCVAGDLWFETTGTVVGYLCRATNDWEPF